MKLGTILDRFVGLKRRPAPTALPPVREVIAAERQIVQGKIAKLSQEVRKNAEALSKTSAMLDDMVRGLRRQ